MSDWPREVGDHTVSQEWECLDCGVTYDCFTKFRQNGCDPQ